MSLLYVLFKLSTDKKLFVYLRRRYNDQQLKLLNGLQKSRRKVQNLELQNHFLRSCIDNKVMPNFIRLRIERSKLKFSPSVERTFMLDEIAKNTSTSTYVKSKYKSDLTSVSEWLSDLDKLKFLRHLLRLDRDVKSKKLIKYDKTIQFLHSKRFGSFNPSSSNVLNLSQHDLTSSELFVLNLGLKFSIPPRNRNREMIFSDFESLTAQLHHHTPESKESLEGLHAKLYDLAHGFCGTPVDLSDYRMHRDCFQTYKALKDNHNIVITKPDKGSGIVLLNRRDYLSKMMDILSDQSKFKKLGPASQFDFTVKIQAAFQRRMYKWLQRKLITLSTYNSIRPTGAQRPKLYGLPKTHKPNCPLRPILSMVGTSQHKIAKYLVSILQPVLDKYSRYTIKDSFSFVEMLNNIPSTSINNVHMCSFDIKSLFTNVPLTEVINICISQLYHSEITPPGIPEMVCHELLKMSTVNVQFSFNNEMYMQVDGVAMGSPLGPVLANIFVGYYEEKLFRSCSLPLFYRRYVDDTFALFSTQTEMDQFQEQLSNLHTSLVYTKEDEVDNTLPFLDVLVERSGSMFTTSVYRKPTFKGEYVPWSSFCPRQRKVGLVSCLLQRAIKICSPGKLKDEINQITSIFLGLGYPEFVINRTIKRTLERNKQPTQFGPDKCPVYIRLPYIGPVSARFENHLKVRVEKTFKSVRLKVVYKTQQLNYGLPKDVSPTTERNNVIYHYKCHCNSEYVGRTSQRFHQRRDQHVTNNIRKWILDPTCRKPRANYFTAIGKHLLSNRECADNYTDDNFTILARGRNRFHLSTLESLYIQTLKPELCKQKQFVYKTKLFKMLL